MTTYSILHGSSAKYDKKCAGGQASRSLSATDPALYDYLSGIEASRFDKDDADALIRECSPPRMTYDLAGTTIDTRTGFGWPRLFRIRQNKCSAVAKSRHSAARTRPLRQRCGSGMQIDPRAMSLVRDFVNGGICR